MAKNMNFLKNILDTKNQLTFLKMYIKLLTQTKKMNQELADIINNASIDLKNDIKEMCENEIETENPNETVDLVKKILDFNKQNHAGQGLKILNRIKFLVDCPLLLRN